MASAIGDREKQVRARLMNDFPHYAERCLRIRAKAGGIEQLTLNPAQSRLQQAADRQMAERGRVRLLVLKGRQMGVSTYIEGRFHWRTSHRRGVRAFILTHRDQATQNLFAMAKRFHAACPALLRPKTGTSNLHELLFKDLDSGYRVATAKAPGVGRSETIQFFHGSEVAFWPELRARIPGQAAPVPAFSTSCMP